jgi:hypothetical protein
MRSSAFHSLTWFPMYTHFHTHIDPRLYICISISVCLNIRLYTHLFINTLTPLQSTRQFAYAPTYHARTFLHLYSISVHTCLPLRMTFTLTYNHLHKRLFTNVFNSCQCPHTYLYNLWYMNGCYCILVHTISHTFAHTPMISFLLLIISFALVNFIASFNAVVYRCIFRCLRLYYSVQTGFYPSPQFQTKYLYICIFLDVSSHLSACSFIDWHHYVYRASMPA